MGMLFHPMKDATAWVLVESKNESTWRSQRRNGDVAAPDKADKADKEDKAM